MELVEDKLQYIESYVTTKDKQEKKKPFFKNKSFDSSSYNSFRTSQKSLNYVKDSGDAQENSQSTTGYTKDGVQYKKSLQERKQTEKCHNCDKIGHWARECRSPKKQHLNITHGKVKDERVTFDEENKNSGSYSDSSLQDLLLVKARLYKNWQSVMIDIGASGCFIGLELVEKLKLDFEVNHVEHLVEIADGRELKVVGRLW